MKYVTTVNGEVYEIEINREGEVIVNGEPRQVDFRASTPSLYSLIIDNQVFEAAVENKNNSQYGVLVTGDLYEVTVTDERARRLAAASGSVLGAGESSIVAPMPGMVVKVPVVEGQEVQKGDTVVILESMKMQNELKATQDGMVHAVRVQAGESVEQNQVLVILEPVEEN